MLSEAALCHVFWFDCRTRTRVTKLSEENSWLCGGAEFGGFYWTLLVLLKGRVTANTYSDQH